MHVQGTGRELDRQSSFLLWSPREGVTFRGGERKYIYRFTIIYISLYFEYSEPIYK